jgi:hypothetical protein
MRTISAAFAVPQKASRTVAALAASAWRRVMPIVTFSPFDFLELFRGLRGRSGDAG